MSPMKQVRVRRWLLVTVLCAMAALPAAAWVVASTTSESRALITAIQRERSRNIRQGCEDTNARHDSTIATLDRLLAFRLRHATRADRLRLRQSRVSTVLLIDALVPFRDCRALVAQQVKTNP